MKTLAPELRELIDAVVAERDVGNITAAIFEKDVHITDALRVLFEKPLQVEGAALVFCGGTSLSKGVGWIHRMSEDLDIKVCSNAELARGIRKQVREEVRARLEAIGLVTNPDQWEKHHGSRQVVMEWRYQPQYAASTALRPHLLVELRFDGTRQPPVNCTVETLLARHVGTNTPPGVGEPTSVACQNAGETLAEKVMAYLRRSQAPATARERSLARHLHDVHAMTVGDPALLDVAVRLFPDIAAEEQRSYRDHFGDTNIQSALEAAVAATGDHKALRAEYEREVVPLLFSQNHTPFDDVLTGFQHAARQCIASLQAKS